MGHWETQLRRGLAELAVLATIARQGEAYGYRIVEHLRDHEGLDLTESTVYPLLTRLARDGALDVRSEASPGGPTRRYYRLTADGRRRLSGMARGWATVSRSLARLLGPGPEGMEEGAQG